jgi:hypothetical protein
LNAKRHPISTHGVKCVSNAGTDNPAKPDEVGALKNRSRHIDPLPTADAAVDAGHRMFLDSPEQCCGVCLPTFVEKGSA